MVYGTTLLFCIIAQRGTEEHKKLHPSRIRVYVMIKNAKRIVPMMFVAMLLMISCFGSGTKKDVANNGDRVIISECFAAASDDAYREMHRYCRNKDEYNMKLMIAMGTARIVSERTTGTVIKSHFASYEVRTDDDLNIWLVDKEFVSKKR